MLQEKVEGEGLQVIPTVTMEIEKNSRGANWKVAVNSAESPEKAIELLRRGIALIKKEVAKETE